MAWLHLSSLQRGRSKLASVDVLSPGREARAVTLELCRASLRAGILTPSGWTQPNSAERGCFKGNPKHWVFLGTSTGRAKPALRQKMIPAAPAGQERCQPWGGCQTPEQGSRVSLVGVWETGEESSLLTVAHEPRSWGAKSYTECPCAVF